MISLTSSEAGYLRPSGNVGRGGSLGYVAAGDGLAVEYEKVSSPGEQRSETRPASQTEPGPVLEPEPEPVDGACSGALAHDLPAAFAVADANFLRPFGLGPGILGRGFGRRTVVQVLALGRGGPAEESGLRSRQHLGCAPRSLLPGPVPRLPGLAATVAPGPGCAQPSLAQAPESTAQPAGAHPR